MLKNAKLGQRIGMGFGALIIIAVALGGLAVVNMTRVKGQSQILANEHVKAWSVANQVERDSLATMYAMRGYALSQDAKFWETGSAKLKEVEGDLEEGVEA